MSSRTNVRVSRRLRDELEKIVTEMGNGRPAASSRGYLKKGSSTRELLASNSTSLASSQENLGSEDERCRGESSQLKSLLSKNFEMKARSRSTASSDRDIEEGSDCVGDDDVFYFNNSKSKGSFCTRHRKAINRTCIGIPLCLLFIATFLFTGIWMGQNMGALTGPAAYVSQLAVSARRSFSSNPSARVVEKMPFEYNKPYVNIAGRNDFRLQECQGPELKSSFPDLGYAFLGYNVLKGYPLATGHDPGFTLPIFIADYTESRQTSDCRYSVPRGVFVIPDESCVLSFTSKVIQTRHEFSKSLAASAEINAGGWGARFSASAGYKQTSSTISTGEFAYIMSTANCKYYYSQQITSNPPPFDPSFVKWVEKLNKDINNDDTFFNFFEEYGTHFPKRVTFGARYTQENKIQSTKLEKMSKTDTSVGVLASYSGLFSAGAGFNMDQSQREQASEFQKNVEKKIITVGASPPANGDAQKWASMVRENPVPVSYDLVSIEKLFTAEYMEGLKVNYTAIANRIRRDDFKLKQDYCDKLKSEDLVDTCEELSPGLKMEKTKLQGHYRYMMADEDTCIEECMAEVSCVAISLCRDCGDDSLSGWCYLFKEGGSNKRGFRAEYGWSTFMFLPKIVRSFELEVTEIKSRGRWNGVDNATFNECWKECLDHEPCVAFDFHEPHGDRRENCRTYSETNINDLSSSKSRGLTRRAYFISRHSSLPTIPPTTTSAKSGTNQPNSKATAHNVM